MASRINIKDIIKTRNKVLQKKFAQELAEKLYDDWNNMVEEMNPRFGDVYKKAMSMYVRDNYIIIELDYSKAGDDAEFVRAIEYGFGSGGIGTSGHYDMRVTLLNKAKGEVNMNNRGYRYRDIPMRSSANKVASHGGQRAVDAARKLAYYRNAAARKSAGSRYMLPAGRAPIIHPHEREVNLGNGTVTVPAHATDPLAQLYRFNKPGTADEFGIFRRISEDPDTGKPWVGAPIKQHRLMRRLKRRIPSAVKYVKGEGG